jgi:hypothetical protein
MKLITKRRIRWVAAPLLVAASIAMASPAFAVTWIGQNQPTVVQAVQGSTATLLWSYKNTGGSGNTPPAGGTITFNAPTGTTFPAQSTVPTSYSTDGTTFGANNATLTGCTVGSGGTTLSCNITSANGGNSGWATNAIYRFSPTVAVSPTAPPGTFSAAASMQWNDPTRNNVNTTITDGTLDVNIVQSASTPMVDPLVGLGAGALVLGTGAAVVLNRRRRAGAGT